MEESKKRKLKEVENDPISEENLRNLLAPLTKVRLIDLLCMLGSKHSPVAGEIMSFASADPVHRKIFVRNLTRKTTSETLRAAFSEFGEIEKATKICRGYGFIIFKNMESAQNAIKASGKQIDMFFSACDESEGILQGPQGIDRFATCDLPRGVLSGANIPTDLAQRKLFVKGLSGETTSGMLRRFFRKHGDIEEGSIVYDRIKKKPLGYGFVTYKTVEAAKRALADTDRNLNGKLIEVMFANPTSEAANQLPSAAVPMVPPIQSGNLQPEKPQVPLGYSDPQHTASYPPPTLYPRPPAAPTAAPLPAVEPGPYSPVTPSQFSYIPPPPPSQIFYASPQPSQTSYAPPPTLYPRPPAAPAAVPLPAVAPGPYPPVTPQSHISYASQLSQFSYIPPPPSQIFYASPQPTQASCAPPPSQVSYAPPQTSQFSYVLPPSQGSYAPQPKYDTFGMQPSMSFTMPEEKP